MNDMSLGMSRRLKPIHRAVADMVRDEIAPLGEAFLADVPNGGRFVYTARQSEILEGLKALAKSRGLWNFWLTDSARGSELSTVEYACLAEEKGKAHLGAETFNCSAPDTGNMKVFERYCTPEQQASWLGQPGHAAGPQLDASSHSALRRRTGRHAPPAGLALGAEEAHAGEVVTPGHRKTSSLCE